MKHRAVIYLGPHDAVEVPLLDDEGRRTIVVAEREGAPVELPADVAASLLETEAWTEPGGKPKRTPRKPARRQPASSSAPPPADASSTTTTEEVTTP